MRRFALLLFAAALGSIHVGLSVDNAPVYRRDVLMGHFEPSQHGGFSRLPSRYTNRESAWLRTEVAQAFRLMADSAARDGVTLRVVSATRNYSYQQDIWTRKWNSLSGDAIDRTERILEYSSMPGTSRHHWGTDLDINSVDPEYFERGTGREVYTWMTENARKFGFFQPYTEQTAGRTGYNEEKWHWSYQPTARKLLKAYNHLVKLEHITGFPGSEVSADLDVIGRYVNGISEFPGNPFYTPPGG